METKGEIVGVDTGKILVWLNNAYADEWSACFNTGME